MSLAKDNKPAGGYTIPRLVILILVIALATLGGWAVGRRQQPAIIDDRAAIIEAIDNYCKIRGHFINNGDEAGQLVESDWHVVGQENYENPDLFKRQGNFVNIAAGCENEKVPEEERGSGFRFILVKRPAGSWLVVSATQDFPACFQLDGYGIPNGFVECLGDDYQSRNPR